LQGLSDHLVSEAIYLADPDGNGIEIYRDRPRDEWRTKDGALQMGTIAMDVDGTHTAASAEQGLFCCCFSRTRVAMQRLLC
jgi:catechol 2,3-dioxygenase